MLNSSSELWSAAATAMAPRSRIRPSEWAERHVALRSEQAARPGPFSCDWRPWTRAVHDAHYDNPEKQGVVTVKPEQVGLTRAMINVIGCLCDSEPGPTLYCTTDQPKALTFAQREFMPMVEDIPHLRELFKLGASQQGRELLGSKPFVGGVVDFIGSGSEGPAISVGRRYVVLDEMQKSTENFPVASGDLWSTLTGRVKTYRQAGLSLVFAFGHPRYEHKDVLLLYETESDMRRWVFDCPHCSEKEFNTESTENTEWRASRHQGIKALDTASPQCRSVASVVNSSRIIEPCSKRIRWGGLQGDTPDHEVVRDPDQAVFVCPHCGAVITDRERARAVWPPHLGGTGRFESSLPPEVAAKRKYVGLAINGLCDPYVSVRDFALEWVNARTPEKLQTFFNKRLGEAFIENEVVLTEDTVAAVMAHVPGTEMVVPNGAAYLVAGGDVQAPRHFPSVYSGAGVFMHDGFLYITDLRICSGFDAFHAWLRALRVREEGGRFLGCRLATIDAGWETGQVIESCRRTIFSEQTSGRVEMLPVRYVAHCNADNPAVMAPETKRWHPTRREMGPIDYFYLYRHAWVDRAVRRLVEKRVRILCPVPHNFREQLMSNVLRPKSKQHGMEREQLEWYRPDELRDDWLQMLAFLECGAALKLHLDTLSAVKGEARPAPDPNTPAKQNWMNRHRGGGSWFSR